MDVQLVLVVVVVVVVVVVPAGKERLGDRDEVVGITHRGGERTDKQLNYLLVMLLEVEGGNLNDHELGVQILHPIQEAVQRPEPKVAVDIRQCRDHSELSRVATKGEGHIKYKDG